MASKREMARLLAGLGGKGQADTPGSTKGGSSSGAVKSVSEPTSKGVATTSGGIEKAPPAKKLKVVHVHDTPTNASKGKGPAPASGTPASTGPRPGSVDCGVLAPASIDAKLMNESTKAYLNGFSPMSLVRQMKVMSIASATILKYLEAGGGLDNIVTAEKERLKGLAERKIREIEEEAKKETALVKKSLVAAESRADEATRALGEKNQEATALSNDLAAALARATKAEEDLAAKTTEVTALEGRLTSLSEEKDKLLAAVRDAAVSGWDNAQEQMQLAYPDMDISWMAIDAFVEEGALVREDESGNIVRLSYPGSS